MMSDLENLRDFLLSNRVLRLWASFMEDLLARCVSRVSSSISQAHFKQGKVSAVFLTENLARRFSFANRSKSPYFMSKQAISFSRTFLQTQQTSLRLRKVSASPYRAARAAIPPYRASRAASPRVSLISANFAANSWLISATRARPQRPSPRSPNSARFEGSPWSYSETKAYSKASAELYSRRSLG